MLSSASPPTLWQVRHVFAPTLAQTSSEKSSTVTREHPDLTGGGSAAWLVETITNTNRSEENRNGILNLASRQSQRPPWYCSGFEAAIGVESGL